MLIFLLLFLNAKNSIDSSVHLLRQMLAFLPGAVVSLFSEAGNRNLLLIIVMNSGGKKLKRIIIGLSSAMHDANWESISFSLVFF